ncbi:hypothetical protein ACFFV7_20995 [Nonomuraea spiralis]|uniref:Uncharacterized protein n=1 Tax=Nonomuraea spiralis TaxID=46182 RepID=A0ABV5II12_9ACTN|nr:hypothetical protein [Nonomuraea spiralis]GGS98451.1 hypothetical protein GCM10010176_048020 [Nonomuraea spiralis]
MRDLAAQAADALRALDEALLALLKALPPENAGARAALRAELLRAGVTDEVASRCLTVLRTVLSEENGRPSDYIGVAAVFECAFCGSAPDPADLVVGKSVSICLGCALLATAGATRGDREPVERPCAFCGARAVPDHLRADGDVTVCHACGELVLYIIASKKRAG